jgi:hypothetical protein
MIEDLDFSPVPSEAENIFRMCWQFENWLRQMVYIRLKANRIDWIEPIKKAANQWPPRAKESDKKQPYMPTAHEAELSYLTFGELWNVVESEWKLFEPYFPQKAVCSVRISEFKTIRNRIAHFRRPNEHDETRVKLFMSEMEAGLRKLCHEYTVQCRPKNMNEDPVVQNLKSDWDVIGQGIECLLASHEWLYDSDNRMNPRINVGLDFHFFEGASLETGTDVIYRVGVHGTKKDIDIPRLFKSTKSLHESLLHFIVDSKFSIYFTIPAVLGGEKCFELVSEIFNIALNSRGSISPTSVEHCRKSWPEYVLWPDHHLVNYWDEIKDPIIAKEPRESAN